MVEIEGIIKVISKFGGVMLDGADQWYNAVDEAKKEDIKTTLKKGDKVLITHEGFKISAIKVLDAQPSATVPNPPDWDAKDRRIVRQNVLNRAVDMYTAEKISKEEILVIAQNFEEWVYR